MAMTAFKSDFLNVLQERGFIHQISDPEALHVGSMVQIMCLYWLQQTGNKPIALMGGGTTRVGDPSGKDETRKILSIEDINRNKDGIKQVFSHFLNFGHGKSDAIMPDNAEWLTKLNWIEMLRDIGRHFSVNRMLAMDSVKMRLDRDQEMSFIEFNYMILQAYDYVVLNQRYDCRLQMGGSDQWGNIVNGIDLGRRMGTPQLHALTTPLITTSNGEKMGKTASGAVWLNADMKSPYEYWQFWRNTDDADVVRFLKLFTTLPLGEIDRLAALQGAEINEAKKALADAATTLLHRADAAKEASETARQTFEEGAIAENLPTEPIPVHEQKFFYGPDGLSVIIAVQLTRLVRSNGEARRLIESRGVKINDETVESIMATLTPADLRDGVIKVSLGKKRHVLLRPA
jgi:tyrosyl-tRNA synthetase